MDLVLAVDGGGTGCRAALADRTGRVLARATGGPANIASDTKAAMRNLRAVCDQVLQGVDPAGCHVVMGLAGANAAGSVAALRAGLPFADLRIETDARIAVAGALQGADGIVAVLGTGSVFARQTAGRMHIIGGHGLTLGDEASGGWLGRGLLSAAARAADRLGPSSPLLDAVLGELGGLPGVIGFSLTARPADFARFAPRLFDTADPVALALLAQAEADIAGAVAVLQAGADLPVVFLGSLGHAMASRFADRFARQPERLQPDRPQPDRIPPDRPWQLRAALGNALDGALWLGLQTVAAR